MSMHIIENDFLRVTVSDTGAELISVIDKENDAERIWIGDPAIWNRHAPILFPFVGKVMDGKYRIADKAYAMKTQHGFARDLDFTCVEETPVSVTHRLSATDWTRAHYPYEFRLAVTHRLDGKQLFIEWGVENRGAGQMYFSIGGHPGFLMPKGVRKENCHLSFPGANTLRYKNVSKVGYALPETKTISLIEGCVSYQEDIPDTWIFEDNQVKHVGIMLPDGKPWVMLHCDQFPMLAVWANPNGPFICLEPWFGRTDDEGFQGTVDQKKAIQCLGNGEKKEIAYSIAFF